MFLMRRFVITIFLLVRLWKQDDAMDNKQADGESVIERGPVPAFQHVLRIYR
jgi:hypothetical protein